MSPVTGHQPRRRGRTLRSTYLPIVVAVVLVLVIGAWFVLGGGS